MGEASAPRPGPAGRAWPECPTGQWDLWNLLPEGDRSQAQSSPASTSFSSISWLSGSIQKARQGPLPVQKLLEGTHLCNGPIFQHHDPISLGQDVERVGDENPCLGRKGWNLHSCA